MPVGRRISRIWCGGATNMSEPHPRILVVRLGAMGDILHALPAVASLRASFPESEIVWVMDPKWQVLVEGNPHVTRVVPFNRHEWSSVLNAARELRRVKIDFAVDFQGLIKSALLATSARPERIYGFARGEARELPATWCYSNLKRTKSAHVVDKNLELAAEAGARRIVHEFPIPAGTAEGDLPAGPFVLANPLAGWPSKQWPLEYYQELARLIPVPLVLNTAASGVEQLRAVSGAWIHISGLAGLIDATRRARAVVGLDSGPMHLAAALGKPGAAIFGPTDPARNGPYGGSLQVFRVACAETTYKRGDRIADSMRAIRPAEVAASIREIL